MVNLGCNKADPWAGEMWQSDSTGAAGDLLSVSQVASVAGKVVVVHSGSSKVGCGVIQTNYGACSEMDPWSSSTYTSGGTGSATGAVSSVCAQESIENRVVVVHDSSRNKVACGKLRKNLDGSFTAEITKMHNAPTARAPRGTFHLQQTSAFDVQGSFTLDGLENSATGMWHVHEGVSCLAPGGHLMNPNHGLKADITPFPGSGSSVSGHFAFNQNGAQLRGEYSLAGLDATATGMYHVHTGTSCAAPGGHLVNEAHTHSRRLSAADAQPNSHSHDDDIDAGNAVCTPCIPGVSFSAIDNAPGCYPVTPCAQGNYETAAGTATGDRTCGACTNGPANSFYTTSGGKTSDCKFGCNAGYTLTKAGTECSKNEQAAKVTFKGRGQIAMFDNGVMQLTSNVAGGCVDAPDFCSGSFTAMQNDIKSLKADMAAVKAYLKNDHSF